MDCHYPSASLQAQNQKPANLLFQGNLEVVDVGDSRMVAVDVGCILVLSQWKVVCFCCFFGEMNQIVPVPTSNDANRRNEWLANLLANNSSTLTREPEDNCYIYEPHPKEIEHGITPFLRFFCFHSIHSISTLLLMIKVISPDFFWGQVLRLD